MKKYLPIIIIVSLVVIAGVSYFLLQRQGGDEESAAKYIKTAEEFLENKEYSKALEQYKLAINMDPTNADTYISAADIYVLKSKYDQATELLSNGESSVGEVDKIYHKIGQILLEQNDVEGALRYFEDAFKKNSDNWQNAIDLVKVYSYYQDKKTSSVNKLSKVKTSDEDGIAWIYYYRGLLEDDVGKMIQNLEKAEEAAKGEDKQKFSDFLKVARKVQSEPDDIIENNTLLGYEMLEAGLFVNSITLLDKVIKQNDEYYAAYMYKGICYIKMNNQEKAKENLELATNVEPNQIQPWLFLAQVYTLMNNQQQAIETYEQALTLEKENEDVRYDYAKTLEMFKQWGKARLQYLELIEQKTQNIARYRIELSFVDLDQLEEYDEALTNARQIVEDWDGFESAEKSLQAEALDALGWAYQKNGKKDEALKYLRDAINTDPYLASAYYHEGVVYAELENFAETKINLERAIDLDTSGVISPLARAELDKLENPKDENSVD